MPGRCVSVINDEKKSLLNVRKLNMKFRNSVGYILDLDIESNVGIKFMNKG